MSAESFLDAVHVHVVDTTQGAWMDTLMSKPERENVGELLVRAVLPAGVGEIRWSCYVTLGIYSPGFFVQLRLFRDPCPIFASAVCWADGRIDAMTSRASKGKIPTIDVTSSRSPRDKVSNPPP